MPGALSGKRERHNTFMAGWQMDGAVPPVLKHKGTNRQESPKVQNSGAHRE